MHEEKQHHENHEGHAHHESHESHATHAKKPRGAKINQKTVLTVLCLLLAGVLVYWALCFFVAATVNGVPVSRYSIMHGLEKTNGKAFLESLIAERVIVDEARKRGIVVSEADVALEMSNIEKSLTEQGASMDDLLAAQGMTRDSLMKQMMIRKKVELLLGDKVAVSPAEVDQYIKDSKLDIQPDKLVEARAAITEQLKSQKLQKEAGVFVDELRAKADVRFYGFYKKDDVMGSGATAQ